MKIEHIDEILPHINERPDFVVAAKEGYTVIDYKFTEEDSFDHPARLECRGIKFGEDGWILARPFAKFFNIGEREDTQPHALDFEKPHTITEKLDGSMIHAALLDGEVVFMTRMGCTDHAKIAEDRHCTPVLEGHLLDLLHEQYTPIFEWVAPDNRIVVPYQRSRLVLLAARHMVTGEYLPRSDAGEWAKSAGVELVNEVSSDWRDGHSFVEYARSVTGHEGFVIRFEDGLWVKAKGDDYVMKHKAKDSIGLEKNALAVVLEGGVDDVMPLLTDEDAENLKRYQSDVWAGVRSTANRVQHIVDEGAHLDQKTFAVEHMKDEPGNIRSLAFSVRSGKDAVDCVRDLILKNASTGTKLERVKPLYRAQWGGTSVQEAA